MKSSEINEILKKYDIDDEKLGKALEEILRTFISHRTTMKTIDKELTKGLR